jgi:hypothetical protein
VEAVAEVAVEIPGEAADADDDSVAEAG